MVCGITQTNRDTARSMNHWKRRFGNGSRCSMRRTAIGFRRTHWRKLFLTSRRRTPRRTHASCTCPARYRATTANRVRGRKRDHDYRTYHSGCALRPGIRHRGRAQVALITIAMLQHSVTFDRMVVIKSKLSGYYFKDFGIWTSRADEAVMFPSEWLARA